MEKGTAIEGRKAILRTLSIFAFIFVIIIGIFGSLMLARSIPNLFSGTASAISSIFTSSNNGTEKGEGTSTNGGTAQSLVVSASTDIVTNNQAFTLSWGHSGKTTDGTYAFHYDCTDGISFTSPTGQSIACGTPFTLENAGSVALTTHASTTVDKEISLWVDFIPQGAGQAAIWNAVQVTVKKAVNTGSAPGSTGTGTTITYPVVPVSDPNGFVDLSVRVVGVGVVNASSGTFYPTTYPSRSSLSDRIAIRFEVKNEGTKTSPQWFFRANLPTTQTYTFNSQAQQALRPGESIIFTLAFDGFVNSNTGVASVTVDPSGYIAESNENNNYISQVINTAP